MLLHGSHNLVRLNRGVHRRLHVPRNIKPSVLSTGCIEFLKELNAKCKSDHADCLTKRAEVFRTGTYGYREDTRAIREGVWIANTIPDDLKRRHVEITGPGNDAKMVINALNTDANGYMLDLEDSMVPSWNNVMDAHANIIDAVRGKLTAKKLDEKTNQVIKEYSVTNLDLPTLFVRVRGIHMFEDNVLDKNHRPISATIFDIGTHLYHNAKHMASRGSVVPGPYLYVPKLESYEDALFINKVISEAEKMLNLPNSPTKVTALMETYPAMFQMNEIIYALKDRMVGLNCGRWDYLFSMIKCLGNKTVLPDKNLLTMDKPFLQSYVKQIVSTSHSRNIHAIGGMSAVIPTKNEAHNADIVKSVLADKMSEIERGCDGAWVAHPALIKPVKELFESKLNSNNQFQNSGKEPEYICLPVHEMSDMSSFEHKYSEEMLRKNVSISLQYIAAWLSGNGAVGLNNMMEDLATAEISIYQIKQWLHAEQNVTDYTNNMRYTLTPPLLNTIIFEEYQKYIHENQVKYASNHYGTAKLVLEDYIYGDYQFLPQVASKYLQHSNTFQGIQYDDALLKRLGGSLGYLSGVDLTKHRGEYLNRILYDGSNRPYKFLGTTNGVAAVNVVAGGKGTVGPYAGGWQTNAMKNRLGMLLPDTLHVSPEEVAVCAQEINNHLTKADCIQHLHVCKTNGTPSINYHDIALLADMEQGWNTPEKIRISVKLAIENGVNVIHIEDQGEKKRCGHLGDKELNVYEDYALILRAANLAAQEILGKEQAEKQWVRFVARTDAYSAKRIVNSGNLYNPAHDEHKFVDWKRGTTADGKYLYLKQGVNPDTGRTWGMDLSIERGIKVVEQGLASHVWMETPNADLDVAREYLINVNKVLMKKGKRAQGLYNHSPSFDWDVKFSADAIPLATALVNKLHGVTRDLTTADIHKLLCKHGSDVKGDHIFGQDAINNILVAYKEEQDYDRLKYRLGEIIVDERLNNFSKMLSSFGFNMHLITLPEFHITAFNMHKLSKEFIDNGINAFVKHTQRPERLLSEVDPTFTYYKHQTATGTGVEAAFSEAVGSTNVNILADSTEADDILLRKK
jgi:malate synthase